MTWQNIWPILSIAVNLLLALLLFALRSSIRIAILELKDELTGKYATTKALERLEERVDLNSDLRDFAEAILQLLRERGTTAAQPGGFVDR